MPDPTNPFDLSTFKEIARKAIQQKTSINKNDYSEELFTMVLALSAAVKKLFFEKSENKFSSEPAISKKMIIQFINRMRIEAMEKFNATTFLSTVHFYKNAPAQEKNDPVGLIIVYIERTFVPEMLRLLKYPYIDYDDDDEVLDGMGAIANLIAGYFKKELAHLGYNDLLMSPFKSAINSVLDGVEYCKDQTQKYEISFDIDDKKRMVVELVMSPLPKASEDQ